MVGLLVEIGKEVVPPRAVRDVINSKSRRALSALARTAPSQGLYLMSVKYDDTLSSTLEDVPRASSGNWKCPTKAAVYTVPSEMVDKEPLVRCTKRQRH